MLLQPGVKSNGHQRVYHLFFLQFHYTPPFTTALYICNLQRDKLYTHQVISFKRYVCAAIAIVCGTCQAKAQQFVGLYNKDYTAIQLLPTNPAFVNYAQDRTELNIFGASALVGTNAYLFKREWLLSGNFDNRQENVDYYKNLNEKRKFIWANVDVLGPAASFNIKNVHNVGVYTRFREIIRAGNLTNTQFMLLGKMDQKYYNVPLDFEKAGLSTHSFGEVGFSYGRVLRNDYNHIFTAGATIKYLMGFAAASVYTNSTVYTQQDKDTIVSLQGDITGLFSYNANPIDGVDNKFKPAGLFERAGRGSLGLDMGVHYEYHADGDPNKKTPYSYSISASITDIGAITYFTDTGSGNYTLTVDQSIIESFNVRPGELFGDYIGRLVKDSLLVKNETPKKFRVGLPTAFRLNADYNATERLNIAVNILLSMRGNTRDIYRTGYVSSLNMTPTFGKKVKIGLPLTFEGPQTVTLGAIVHAGPFYLGSNGLFSTLLSSNIKNAGVYMGLTLRLKKDEYIMY
jgi:hypothetical protein